MASNVVETNSIVHTLDDIANILLQEKFLLTALELYTEAFEYGAEIPLLRDFFTNPVNFDGCQRSSFEFNSPSLNRSSSQITLDSLDWTRCSEDGEKAQDDKITILEFELRKAQKTIQNLRENLTQVTVSSEIDSERSGVIPEVAVSRTNNELKSYEAAVLNFLINEYLVMRNYKMTANTFADENEADFEKWDDVGLNIPRPPTLIQWLQEKFTDLSPKRSIGTQTDTNERTSKTVVPLSKEIVEKEEILELKSNDLAMDRKVKTLSESVSFAADAVINPEKCVADFTRETLIDNDIETGKNVVRYTKKSESCEKEANLENISSNLNESTQSSINMNKVFELGQEFTSIEDYIENPLSLESEIVQNNFVEEKLRNIEENVQFGSQFDTTEAVQTFSVHSVNRENIKDELHEMISKDFSLYNNEISDHLKSIKNIPPYSCLTSEVSCDNGNFVEVSKSSSNQNTVDPLKCDRMPPLGASSESIPLPLLTEDFMASQMEEAKLLLRSSSKKRTVPASMESRVLNLSIGFTAQIDLRLQNELVALSFGETDFLTVVSSSLFNIVPNVILAKREKLLPLLVYCISNHSNGNERERLIHLLFNLIKKPNKEQRCTILLGLINLARILGPNRLESELLPQCWEQLSHKHPERRILVAESVAVLAPYTPPELRNSLLFSMLSQMLGPGGEKDATVREAALTSLTLLVLYLDDVEKISSLLNILIESLEVLGKSADYCGKSLKSTNVYIFLSTVAYWCMRVNRLSSYFNAIFERLSRIVLQVEMERSNGDCKTDLLFCKVISILKGLNVSIPFLTVSLIESLSIDDSYGVNPKIIYSSSDLSEVIEELNFIMDCNHKTADVLFSLHSHLNKDYVQNCDELKYITFVFLPKLIEIISDFDLSQKGVIVNILEIFSRLCQALGPTFQNEVLSPLLLNKLQSYSCESQDIFSVPVLLVVYIVVILGESTDANRSEQIQTFLCEHISLAAKNESIEALETVISLLLEKTHLLEDILSVLWSSVVHTSPDVRVCSSTLWVQLVGRVKEAELSSRVIPALVTLATDTDASVRASALKPLVCVVASSVGKEVRDKVSLQLDSLCEISDVFKNPKLQLAISNTCTTLTQNIPVDILQNVFFPVLLRVCVEGYGAPSERLAFNCSFLEALTALTSRVIPSETVMHYVLPSLNQLRESLGTLCLEYMETINALTKEYTLRAQPSSEKLKNVSSWGEKVGVVVGSPSVGMKDKMTKMFSSAGVSGALKSPSVNLPSLFKKK